MKNLILRGLFGRRVKVELSNVRNVVFMPASQVLSGEEIEYNGLSDEAWMFVIHLKDGGCMTYCTENWMFEFE